MNQVSHYLILHLVMLCYKITFPSKFPNIFSPKLYELIKSLKLVKYNEFINTCGFLLIKIFIPKLASKVTSKNQTNIMDDITDTVNARISSSKDVLNTFQPSSFISVHAIINSSQDVSITTSTICRMGNLKIINFQSKRKKIFEVMELPAA